MNREQMTARNEAEVRQRIESWAKAISHGNRAEILGHHHDQFLLFDLATIEHGIEAYDRTWDSFYADPKGPIRFIPSEIQVTAGEDVAFASCLIHCDGTSAGPLDLRLTVGLRKIDGEWLIVHEHHSVPTVDEKFVDATHFSTDDHTNPARAH